MLQLATQTATLDLTSEKTAVTLAMPASPGRHLAGILLAVGTAENPLASAAGTLTVRVTDGGAELYRQEHTKPDGVTAALIDIPNRILRGGQTVAVLVTSSSGSDSAVAVTGTVDSADIDYKSAQGLAVDATSISGSATAADNLESFLLGTGHTDGVLLAAAGLTLDAATAGVSGGHGLTLKGGPDGGNGLDATGGLNTSLVAGQGAGIMARGHQQAALDEDLRGGFGHGLYCLAGKMDGHGVKLGGEVGNALYCGTHGANPAILAVGGSTGGSGLQVQGQGGGHGLYAIGATTGHGVYAIGGATSGNGLFAQGQGNGHGARLLGAGTGYGLKGTIEDHGTGLGSKSVTIDCGGATAGGCSWWVTSTNDSQAAKIYSGVANSAGIATGLMDDGNYYLWREKSGVTFTNPQSLEVS